MTSYFDSKSHDVAVLYEDVNNDMEAVNYSEHIARADAIETAVVWDVTLVAEWPGCPTDIRDDIHRAVLDCAAMYDSLPLGYQGREYETLADRVWGLGDMLSRLHDAFHDLGSRNLDGFSDSPTFPLRCMFGRGYERREQLVPVPLEHWRKTIAWYEPEDRADALARVGQKVYDFAKRSEKSDAEAESERQAALKFLTEDL